MMMENKTIAYSCLYPAENELAQEIINKAISFVTNKDLSKFDLFPMYSLMVSTGWNKNTDVFSPEELWKARSSPEDKPLNFMHNQKNIIGHIVENIVVDNEFNVVTRDDVLPDKMHIVTASVIYKYWDDPEVQKTINQIIDELPSGKWFVSMECLFKNFDYALIDTQGIHKSLSRSEDSAFLTKYLRQYGGPGEYQNHKVGRRLKDITFSGLAIVNNPANPHSIISNQLNIFDKNTKDVKSLGYITLEQLHNDPSQENIMSEKLTIAEVDFTKNPLYLAVSEKLEAAMKDKEKAEKEYAELKKKMEEKVKSEMSDLENELAEARKSIASLTSEVTSVKSSLDKEVESAKAIKGENDAMRATIDAYEKASRSKARADQLINFDNSMSRAQAEKIVADCEDLSDTSFTAMIATMSSYKKTIAATPETVVETAKPEVNVNYGNSDVNTDKFSKVTAQIAEYFKSNTKKGK